MSASLFAAVPASAETTNETATSNPYELIYDISANYTEQGYFKKDGDVIYYANNDAGWQVMDIKLPADKVEKTNKKKVRLHYEYKSSTDQNQEFLNIIFGNSKGNNEIDTGYATMGLISKPNSNKTNNALGYGAWAINDTNQIKAADGSSFVFEKDKWYDIDTIIDFKEQICRIYIDGEPKATYNNTTTNNEQLFAFRLAIEKSSNKTALGENYPSGTQYWRNMKIDTGFGVDVTNTSDNGATLNFTEPVTDLSPVTVKCLEKGTTQTANATKVNDMQYTITYNVENSVGGDYALVFSDEFAAAHGMTSNTVVYSQTPSGYASNEVLFDAYDAYKQNKNGKVDVNIYANGKFDAKEENGDKLLIAPKESWRNGSPESGWATQDGYFELVFSDELAKKMNGKKVRFIYDYKHNETNENFGLGFVTTDFFVKKTDNSINREMMHTAVSFVRQTSDKSAVVMVSNGIGNPYSLTEIIKDKNNTNVGFPADQYVNVCTDYDFKNHKVVYNVGGTTYETEIPNLSQNGVNKGYTMDTLYAIRIHTAANNWLGKTQLGEQWNAQPKYFKNMQLIDLSECNYGIKSVSYSADGTNFAPAIDKVDCEAKYVKIEFTNPMDSTTLDKIAVSKNATDLTVASRTLTNGNKTYTIELTNTLAANSQYDVIVPDTVKTESGVKFNKAYEGTITTTAGTLAVKALKIKKGDTEITAENKNIIAANDKVKAYAEIKNTTERDEPAYVCVCVYNNGVLTGVNFDKVELKKEATTNGIATKEVEVDVKNTENLTIKAFVWEDFSSMVPLSASYGI